MSIGWYLVAITALTVLSLLWLLIKGNRIALIVSIFFCCSWLNVVFYYNASPLEENVNLSLLSYERLGLDPYNAQHLPLYLVPDLVLMSDKNMKDWKDYFIGIHGNKYIECGERVLGFLNNKDIGEYKILHECTRRVSKEHKKKMKRKDELTNKIKTDKQQEALNKKFGE